MPALKSGSPATAVLASIDFLDPSLSEKPFSSLGPPTQDGPATNIKPFPVETEIIDLRCIEGYPEQFTVETSGFQVCGVWAVGGEASLTGFSTQVVEQRSSALSSIDTPTGLDAYFREMEQCVHQKPFR